jgi:ABC-type uncharacterized transport system permease subunit
MIQNSLDYSIPLILAALGGLISELSGILNIALDGAMLVGAFAGAITYWQTGSMALALLAVLTGTFIFALIQASVSRYLGANPFIAGLGANLFAAGIIGISQERLIGTQGVLQLPELNEFYPITRMVWLALVLILLGLVQTFVKHSKYGIRLRASGLDPESLRRRGISPERYQFFAIIAAAMFAGMGGFFLLQRLGAWVPYISAGRGWIALVLVYLGRKNPYLIALAGIAFAFLQNITLNLQPLMPNGLSLALPYFLILIYYLGSLGLSNYFSRKRKRLE